MFRRISWYDLKDSLWFRPTIMTIAAVILALLTVRLDHELQRHRDVSSWWLFAGGADGARGVLATIGSTSITVATMAFSFTIVALQLGSSQFSPRILRSFTGDRANQTVLGIFVGTFAYSLMVLRVITSGNDRAEPFVPAISVSLALVLAGVCIGALIFYIHHATRSIQASVIIERADDFTLSLIRSTRDIQSVPGRERLADSYAVPDTWPLVTRVHAREAGYVHDLDLDAVARVAEEFHVLVRIVPRIGDFLFSQALLFSAWAYPDHPDEGFGLAADRTARMELDRALRTTLEFGLERTLERDVLLGFQQMADIALKALSPAINDPTTAMICIDHLGESLIQVDELACRELLVRNGAGIDRVVATQVPFTTYARVAFAQIRHYGASDMVVMAHLLKVMETICARVQPSSQRVIWAIASDVRDDALRRASGTSDHAWVTQAGQWLDQRENIDDHEGIVAFQ